MVFRLLLLASLLLFILPIKTFARVTPNDTYQANRTQFQNNLSKIQDSHKKKLVVQADQSLNDINQKVSGDLEREVIKMGAILEEEKTRQHITSTSVAYGRGSTPLDNAAYYLNYAEEAIAYQKIQDYTPQIGSGNLKGGISASLDNLKADLRNLQNKVLKAKTELKKALDYYEK